jgi:hypothetical protein
LPGLTRQSINLRNKALPKEMDHRVTRLRQGFAGYSVLVRRSLSEGGSPAMTI